MAVGNGLQEKNLNLSIALACRKELQNYNCKAVMTRTTDVYVSLAERKRISDTNNAEIFVSIHNNAFTATARGFETFIDSGFVWPHTAGYRDIMHDIVYAYLKTLNVPDRGKKRGNYYVTREPQASCVLMEYLFVTNIQDAALLKQAEVLEKLGKLTAIGIAQALKLEPKAAPEPPSEIAKLRLENDRLVEELEIYKQAMEILKATVNKF